MSFDFGHDSARRKFPSLQLQNIRPAGAGNRGRDSRAVFIIEFREPIRGLLAFGYAAHFGLGLFVPVAGGES